MSEGVKVNLELLPSASKREKWERWEKGKAEPEVLNGPAALEQCPEETQELIAYLFVQGLGIQEISDKTSLEVKVIRALRTDKTFQMRIVKESRRQGQHSLGKMITGALPEVILRQIHLATDESIAPSVQVSAGKMLLEFGKGKPLPGVPLDTGANTGEIPEDPVEEREQLDREIAALNAQLNPTKKQA